MQQMSARRHLKELQWRLLIILAVFIIGAVLAYQYQDKLMPLLMAPLHGERLIYLNPAGGFSFIFLVSIYTGLALAFPIIVYQLYGFLKPALPTGAQKKSWKIITASFILLIAGLLFGYLVAVPNALTFLYSFASKYVDASLTADSYLNFMIAYTIGIGIVFQVPLLLLLIHSVRPLTPGGLFKSERWVIVIAFIVAAIITPTPDPINQTIIAVPVIFIYQLGVIAVLIKIAKTRKLARSVAKETPLITLPEAKLPATQAATTQSTIKSAQPQAATPLVAKPKQPGLNHPANLRRPLVLDGFSNLRRPAVTVVTKTNALKPIAIRPKAASQTFLMDGFIVPKRRPGY